MLKILIFSGSARQGNFTEHVAEFVKEVTNKRDNIEAEVISPKNLNLNFENEGMESDYPEHRKKVTTADGYILIAPEYNHGYSGSLKFMLDLNLKEYIHKPVSFVGVSAGPWGGTRVIESLLSPVREMGLAATFTDVNITNVQKEVENGKFKNEEQWQKRIDRMLDELVWMAETLKAGRDKSTK
jgi:NAD(P)H-dependent FMN reductase